jgi:hypothetical protein
VIIKTLALLVFRSRPSDARYIQTLIRLPMRTNLRLRDVNGRILSITLEGQLKGLRSEQKAVGNNIDFCEGSVAHDHFCAKADRVACYCSAETSRITFSTYRWPLGR